MNINASTLNIGQSTTSYQISGTDTQTETEELSEKQSTTATAKATETLVSSTDDGISEISSQGDTLSLSEEGLTASQNAVALDVLNTDSDSSSSTSTKDLSSYTESQLKNMLNNGEITQSEYNKELASRQLKNASAIQNFDISEISDISGQTEES